MFAALFENQKHLLDLPVLALVTFFLTFTAVTVQALRPRKAALDQMAALPLLDDSGVDHRPHGVDHD